MADALRAWIRCVALAACLVSAACEPADGPAAIAYDRQPCAHCGMLISEPGFSAQLQLEGEDPLSFDDPGCLLRYRAEQQPRWRAAWYHHAREPRWIPESGVAFERFPGTPMGYGLVAVDLGTAGALALDEAERHVRALHREGTDAPR